MIEAPQDKTMTINYYYHFNICNGDFSELMKALSLPNTFHNTTQVNNYFFLNKKRKESDCSKDEEKVNTNKTTNNDENELKSENNVVELNHEKQNMSKPIFSISNYDINMKKISKRGRKSKSSNCKGYHTKFSTDNILRKIKTRFFHKIVNYINSIILSKYRNKVKVLKFLETEISKNNNIAFNKKLLNMKLKELFDSYKISGKIKLLDKNYNKTIIKSIYDENIIELINILEMTVMQMFDIFRDLKETKLVGFERMDTVIKELENSENDKEYIDKLKKVILSFENYYFKKEKLKSKLNN